MTSVMGYSYQFSLVSATAGAGHGNRQSTTFGTTYALWYTNHGHKKMLQRFTHSEFKKRLRQIYNLAHANASNQFPHFDYRHATEEEWVAFRRSIWEGWKWAQHHIIEDLVYIAQCRQVAQSHLKIARRNRKSFLVKQISAFIADIDRQEAILRSLANSIIWGMYGLRRWLVRQLWAGSPSVPLTSINPSTAVIADDINDDFDSVAILTDITSFANIGDIIVLKGNSQDGGLSVIEVKDGQVNEHLMSLIQEYGPDIQDIPSETLSEIQERVNGDITEQAERLIRQIKRSRNYESLVNDDVGKDSVTGADLHLIGPVMEVEDYDIKLSGMLSAAAITGSVIDVVEGCLWIGVYFPTSGHRNSQQRFLEEITRRGATPGYPVWSLSSSVANPTMQPLFLRSLTQDSIVDILVGDVLVLVYVDLDALLVMARNLGMNTRWTTRQERRELTAEFHKELGFGRNGRTPVFEEGEAKFTMMGGTIGRLVFEGLAPSSLLKIIQRDLNRMKFGDIEDEGASA